MADWRPETATLSEIVSIAIVNAIGLGLLCVGAYSLAEWGGVSLVIGYALWRRND